ncbi:alpha/beta hydrolase [Aspergillus lucknowensis]|uniref:Alpha/beta hydrolase fold-domain-containing protein n=1 Tax=Aspergillus lucknowensis TaxID=176173 RepID=A0ABR4M6Q9_9EURO
MSQTSYPQPPYPLHESIKDLLDPEYAAFYNEHLLHAPQVHYQPVAASRVGGKLIPGGTDPLPVGKTIDIEIPRVESAGPPVPIRIFVPPGPPPSPSGWPVFLWFHGGGWVLGTIDSENSLCTNLCLRANCVVITTDYRLAPEHPYPAAVHDAWETVLWVVSAAANNPDLDIGRLDRSKLAIGGSSAGGNLAAVMTQKALGHRGPGGGISFLYQILVVPVTDNTASSATSESYRAYEHTPALPAAKMLWYRRHYLPNESDWAQPEASPLLAAGGAGTFARLPPALVVVAGLDVLRWEGEEYARRLEGAGVPVEVKVVEGVPHPFIVMDVVLRKGREGVSLLCERLAGVFGSADAL